LDSLVAELVLSENEGTYFDLSVDQEFSQQLRGLFAEEEIAQVHFAIEAALANDSPKLVELVVFQVHLHIFAPSFKQIKGLSLRKYKLDVTVQFELLQYLDRMLLGLGRSLTVPGLLRVG
jgi:hypothetical protein